MRTEETSCTVLHRLIQEQLRYGNPTDARTLLAIQQQALRRGGGSGGAGSSQSSSESLSQDDPQSPQLSTRQEPQGQEHKADSQHSEGEWLYPHLQHEQLPTYEQAKAQSQHLASQLFQEKQPGRAYSLEEKPSSPSTCDQLSWDWNRSHARSLSERLMQLSLQSRTSNAMPVDSTPVAWNYLEMTGCHANQCLAKDRPDSRTDYSPQPHYLFPLQLQETTLHHAQDYDHVHTTPPPPFHSPHHRLIPTVPSPEACHMLSTAPPAGKEVLTISHDQMEILMKENERLKQELEGHAEKAFRIQKLEQEIQRISEAYDTLMQGCVKRETLEKVLRSKLLAEVKRLQELNADLKDNSIQAANDEEAADQHVVAKLCEQNQEQQLRCEQLEKEVQLLRREADVRLRRADTLEAALSTAQSRSRQLQAELQRKNAYVEWVERLQGALAQLQATCEKREGLELRLRTRLEQELRVLRNQQRQARTCPASGSASSTSVNTLLQRLREREERILALEADMMRWEQKYLEESTMREFAMDVAATAAAQRDTNIINHSPSHSSKSSFSEDLPHAELRNQEVENRIRDLYGQIQEKDVVISFLQQRLQQDQENGEVVEGVSSLSPTSSAATSCKQATEKSSMDDQTARMPQCSRVPAAVYKVRSLNEPVLPTPHPTATKQTTSAEPRLGSIQQKYPQPADPFKCLGRLEVEAVEIFI